MVSSPGAVKELVGGMVEAIALFVLLVVTLSPYK